MPVPVTNTFPGDEERRLRALERAVDELKRRLGNVETDARALAQQLAFAGSGGGASGGGSPNALGKTGAGGIAATTGSTVQSGAVTLYDATALPTLTLTSTVATCYNSTPTVVGANKIVQMKQIGGLWFLDVEPC